jgi:antitoxin component of MazEF toxin-antitoxin module
MTTVQSDDRGAVSIPPNMLRQIGVQPNAPVAVEVTGAVIIVRPPNVQAHSIEEYTPERKAELLLNNAVDADDYAQVVEEVRAMGLDPETIPHERPAGV